MKRNTKRKERLQKTAAALNHVRQLSSVASCSEAQGFTPVSAFVS